MRWKVRVDGTTTYGVQVHLRGINRWVGSWLTAEQAARVYDNVALHEFGDRAIERLNFPEDRHCMAEYAPQESDTSPRPWRGSTRWPRRISHGAKPGSRTTRW